jgi:DNA-binding response OmpR family regulator
MERPLLMAVNADMAFLEMIRDFLNDEGYEVIIMRENQAAFEVIVERKPRLVMIELLITDPESGLMVLNKMRLHPETTHIPVILASTTTQLLRDNEAHFRAKGCDILPKPFDLEELLTIVGTYVPPPSLI